MTHVRTVLGPVAPESLGRVMPHEHLLSLVPGPWLNGGRQDDRVAVAVGALTRLKELGFGTIADLTPYGVVGRDADGENVVLLQEIARRSGMHVISGTAVYLEAYSPQWTLDATVAELTRRLVRDATVGIGASGVPAGVLGEQATGLGVITPHEEKCLRAAARAHRETGLAIATHTTHGTMAREQVDILRSEGVDLDRVVIGHLDTQLSVDYARRILDEGVNIAVDTIGKQVWEFFLAPPPEHRPEGEFEKQCFFRADEGRAAMVAELVTAGYGEHIWLAQDLTGAEVSMNPETHGQHGLSYIADVFLPMLVDRGVTAEQCEQLVAGNPARLLTLA